MSSIERVVAIHGVPRSGTSWLGQILNSSPSVAFRFQPLFSYAFKDRIGPRSTREEILQFFSEIYDSEDDFLLQAEQIARGAYPDFSKSGNPTHLVMKHVRYHHILENVIIQVPEVLIVGILRHPCAVLNSWLQAPREFNPSWDEMEEWQFAQSKNQGRPEEFYGFQKWKEVAKLFVRLRLDYPRNFLLVKYAELNEKPVPLTEKIFSFCGLEVGEQTRTFIAESRSKNHPHVNAVYRKMNNNRKWTSELDPRISQAIIEDVRNEKRLRELLDPEDIE